MTIDIETAKRLCSAATAAEFIAAARALVPALIDEVERLRGALADAKSALDCDNRYPSTQANTANLRAWTIVHEAMR